jgi:hypothetical protein
MIVPGILGVAALVSGAYIMMNKKTRRKAGKVIDSAFEEINSSIRNMQK